MMSSLLKVWLQMEETLKKFLDKSQFPEDPEVLKEMIVTIARMSLESFSCFSKQLQVSSENIEYLKSEVAVLKRFQFGQRSERLKKKQLRLLTTTA
jgi:nucleoside recognition membrane protein YjiH